LLEKYRKRMTVISLEIQSFYYLLIDKEEVY